MKSLWLISLLAVLQVATPDPLYAQYTPARLKTLDSALTLLHQQASFNGVVLVAEKGKALYHKAFGIANIQTGEALNLNSAFNLASVSKQFVAMMVMILQEEGRLGFDDKVSAHIPDFPYENISLRHLLTHTSGLPEYFDLVFTQTNTLDTLNNEKLIRLLQKHRPAPEFLPGEKWSYCNTNYVLLASVIEKASGMSAADFLKKRITAPLGMDHTYIYHLEMKSSPADRVYGFQRQNGRNVPNDLIRLDGVVGDGNVYASASDLLKWDQALYGHKLVKAQTWQQAITPVKLNDGSTYPYGFGWFIENEGKTLSHTGSWVGFYNQITRHVADKQTLIILSNSSDFSARRIVTDILAGKTPSFPRFHLIADVRLIDGSGNAARKASVRLRNERIWETGDLQAFVGEVVTKGNGKVLAPGFIDSHSHHFGSLEQRPEALATLNQGITTIVIGQDGSSYAIDTIEAFFKRRPVAVNVATYTGHSTLREEVMGENDLYRLASAEEVARMKALLREEMQKGSLGLATGLEYEEAFYSSRDEVMELAKVAAEYKGRYISHIRSEDIHLAEAVDEIIQIGAQAGLPVQISHIKIAKRDDWGSSTALLAQLQSARAEGVDITADCYPYDFWSSTLRVLFPNRDYTNPASAELAVTQLCDPDKSVLVRYAPQPEYAGKSLSQVAALRNEKTSETLMYLIAEAAAFSEKNPDFDAGIEAIMGKSMDEADVEQFLAWPHTNICSDGSGQGHPRGHGAFTRVLGRYVREKQIMPLETAIYKMTGLTAEHLGLSDIGLILPGYYADLVLLDPETVQDNATIQNSKALSSGIEAVWIGGELVYQLQQPTGKFPGRCIRKNP